MKLTLLDAETLGGDLNFDFLAEFGDIVVFRTSEKKGVETIAT